MVYGFNEDKEKVNVVQGGEISENDGTGTIMVSGNGYIDEVATGPGFVWAFIDNFYGASVRNIDPGAYISVKINDVYVGNFYIGKDTKTLYTPSFPVKEGDVVKVENGYSDTTCGLGIRFIYFNEEPS